MASFRPTPARWPAGHPHNRTRGWRRPLAAVVSAAILLTVSMGCGEAAPEPPRPSPGAPPAPPVSMAALGDSMTRAYGACFPWRDCPESSWSTGVLSTVESHRDRIAAMSGTAPRTHNLAVSGARVSQLEAQAREAVRAQVDYVTILIGGNDACAPTEDAMTSTEAFRGSFAAALTALADGLPQARILVLSVPDLARLWQVGTTQPEVPVTWERFGLCQSMLANPLSSALPDRRRRARVRERVVQYNEAMATECAARPNCRWDGNAVFEHPFTIEMLSAHDYWHPSLLGQSTLAEVSWSAGFWE